MDNGAQKYWSYSVHIVSDSTISFRDASKKNKPSLLPEYNLREHVHGSSQKIMSGCMAPDLQDEASQFNWDQHSYYTRGTHAPM
eukprot:7868356-Pyramimonas_sp.AAC.2